MLNCKDLQFVRFDAAEIATHLPELCAVATAGGYIHPIDFSAIRVIFAVYDDETLVGYAGLGYREKWSLRACVIIPQYRGRGLQQELIRRRLEYLQPLTNSVDVCVLPDNKYSLNNLYSLGFVASGVTRVFHEQEHIQLHKTW